MNPILLWVVRILLIILVIVGIATVGHWLGGMTASTVR